MQSAEVTLGNEGELLASAGYIQESHYTYDAAYAVKTFQDGTSSGHTTHYYYDGSGLLLATTDPGYSAGYGEDEFYTIDDDGHPIFGADADVLIKPTGNRRGDRNAANREAGLNNTPDGKQWHHHQDHGRMQLVDAIEHILTGHSGGWAKWGKRVKKGKESP